jgi:5-amino-6-(5-phosphoribosylamino)uracil reductase
MLHIRVILAMSADGKISDAYRSAARFSSANDKEHLEAEIAEVDATVFGAGTLRAYGTTLLIKDAGRKQRRQDQGRPEQPIHIVCSASGQLDRDWLFFRQPVPRWLLTTPDGAKEWCDDSVFEKVLVAPTLDVPLGKSLAGNAMTQPYGFDWQKICIQLEKLGIERLAVLGGGELVSAIVGQGLGDEWVMTVCPCLLGGAQAPTPIDGLGFLAEVAPRLVLQSAEVIGQEIFLRYQINQARTLR